MQLTYCCVTCNVLGIYYVDFKLLLPKPSLIILQLCVQRGELQVRGGGGCHLWNLKAPPPAKVMNNYVTDSSYSNHTRDSVIVWPVHAD